MTKTKIDWCDYTWNPVWGCNNNCPYCYARKLAKRFGDPTFLPTWKQKNFDKPFPKKPSRIFVNSMSDMRWWATRWMNDVINKIADHPWHTFLFLTKYPAIYSEYSFPHNCWLGTTITQQNEFIFDGACNQNLTFFSFEPLLEHIIITPSIDWAIIGAETGNRQDKIIPKRSWVLSLINDCRRQHIPVFLKDSLREIWGEKLIQEFPQ